MEKFYKWEKESVIKMLFQYSTVETKKKNELNCIYKEDNGKIRQDKTRYDTQTWMGMGM